MIQFNFLDFLLVLLFGIILPFISGIQSQKGLHTIQFDEYTRKRFYFSNSFVLGGMAGVVLLVWWGFDRPFSMMGCKLPKNSNLIAALLIVTVFFYLTDLIISVIKMKRTPNADPGIPFLPERIKELPVYLVMCFSAAVFEEIVFRGYMVTYFIKSESSDIPWIAILYPSFLFGIAHFYQGLISVTKIFLLSTLFALIYIYSESLLYVMIIHFFIDLIGGIAAIFSSKK